jgi:hypothetical protein
LRFRTGFRVEGSEGSGVRVYVVRGWGVRFRVQGLGGSGLRV